MIPIFVINLERNPERRKAIAEQLQDLNLNFQILSATDGKFLKEEDLEKLYDEKSSLKKIQFPLSKNEVACADSHLRLYEKIVAENIPYALILEDDVILDKEILTVLDTDFLQSKKFDWLQIDYGQVGWPFFRDWLLASKHFIKHKPIRIFYVIAKLPYIAFLSAFERLREKINPQVNIVTFYRPLYLTSAYIITNAGAKKLLAIGRPIHFAADMLPNKAHLQTNFKIRAISPVIAKQDKNFESNIAASVRR